VRLLVLADEQTSGRGRRGRSWQAPFGSSLLASLLLRPTFLPPEQAFLLTTMTGLAVAEAIARETGLAPTLKWPNDLLLQERKICGILVELEGGERRLDWAVLGWGLNVNIDFSRDEELREKAISLAMVVGRPLPRLPLLWACLERLESYYGLLRTGRGEEVWVTWRSRLGMLGRAVEVIAPGETFDGIALDVASDGALLVQRGDGTVERVLAGDVTIHLQGHAGNAVITP